MITSTANQKIKRILKLQKKAKARNEEGTFIVEGIRMMKEAPESRIKELYISETFLQKYPDLPENLKKKAEMVSDPVFAHMSDTKTPQGILGVIRRMSWTMDELLHGEDGRAPFLMVLDHLQDPGNLGTILRTGEGAGVTGVVMSSDCVDLYNPKTVRSTMGSVYRVPCRREDDMERFLHKMKEAGIRIYAAHLKGTADYDEEDYTGGSAFLIGNEGNGLKEETARMADTYIRIPMEGEVESLNAAIAATILMFEAGSQRRRK